MPDGIFSIGRAGLREGETADRKRKHELQYPLNP